MFRVAVFPCPGTADDTATLMVEVKVQDRQLSSALKHFNTTYGLPGVQVVADLPQEHEAGPLQIRRALRWLEELG